MLESNGTTEGTTAVFEQALTRCCCSACQVPARDAVVDAIKRVFAVHGAVPMDSAYVGACPVDAPPDMAALLAASGARLALR